jgi:hypothetical protein
MGDPPPVDGRCHDCGFDYDDDADAEIATRIRESGPRFGVPLARAGEGARTRPAPDVWSALEYACHVRDVLAVQRERLDRALAEDNPVLEARGMFRWADEHQYGTQDPSLVLRQLRANADSLATAISALSPAEWARPLVYGHPQQPAERTVRWFLRHTLHECEHHLADAMRS